MYLMKERNKLRNVNESGNSLPVRDTVSLEFESHWKKNERINQKFDLQDKYF